MDFAPLLSQIGALSVDDRIHLMRGIWDGLLVELSPDDRPRIAADLVAELMSEANGADQDDTALTEAQRNELERRLADHLANPTDVIPWEAVKAKALARRRQ
jgi:putative addiction module component (TIGR02574 family)